MIGMPTKSQAAPNRKPPRHPPQQARSRRTREKLIEAAVECFERHGFDDTTTAMIASEAGVAVGTVYNYFTDKREIILELFEATDREIADEVIAQLDPASWRGSIDPRDRTRSLIDVIFHAQRLRPGIQRILWAQYFKDPEFREPFEALRNRIRVAIDAFIVAVDEAGLCRSGLDREMASFVVLNAVQWNSSQAFLNEDPAFRDAAADETAELVARYLFV
ncbi:MAG: TetR/AcrR family transcriptional regulator [Myxococcales bacterium]|nr:TetR/AcrR family transcriptional regulator [Myxococcales bacterium]HIK86340.1 TetR/AcrR family transcriptional regulator [Myxococcales bacterium]